MHCSSATPATSPPPALNNHSLFHTLPPPPFPSIVHHSRHAANGTRHAGGHLAHVKRGYHGAQDLVANDSVIGHHNGRSGNTSGTSSSSSSSASTSSSSSSNSNRGTSARRDALASSTAAAIAGNARAHAIPRRCLCFFDVEASGPSLKHNFVPCLGLAIVALGDGDDAPRTLISRKWFVRPPSVQNCHWDGATLRNFWLKPAIEPFYKTTCRMLSSPALSVDVPTAMAEFVALCRAATYNGRCHATLVSDTSGFDFSWLYFYLSHFGPPDCPSPNYLFGAKYRPVRDVTSYFAGFGGEMAARYPHKDAMLKLGLNDGDWLAFASNQRCPPYDHDPEHDAAHVGLRSAWIIWQMEQRRRTLLAGDVALPAPAASVVDVQLERQHRAEREAPQTPATQHIALLVRTDLRLRPSRVASLCALASVALMARLPAGNQNGGASISETASPLFQMNRTALSKYRAVDESALHTARHAARRARLNHHLLFDDKTGAPTVLAVGPASAASMRAIVDSLRAL